MNAGIDRRLFLGSASLAGAGLLGGTVVLSQSVTPGATAPPGPATPLEDELVAQLKDAVSKIGGARGGEAARKAATTLRTLVAHYRMVDMDAAFRSHLRRVVRRQGRTALLTEALDPETFAAHVRKFDASRRIVQPPPDYAMRTRVLRELLAGGLTPILSRAAGDFDRVAGWLDRYPVSFAADDEQPTYQCPDVSMYETTMEVLTLSTCLWAYIICVVFTGMYVGFIISLELSGCR